MVSVLVVTALLIGLAILVGSMLIGIITASPRRARAVRRAESVSHHIGQAPLIPHPHPVLHHNDRLDRHDAYIWMHVGLNIYGWVVLFLGVPYSALGATSLGTQYSLGVSLVAGSAMALGGSLMGLRVGRWRITRGVAENIASPVLGDDVRAPYILAWCGMLSTIVSMGFYGYTLAASAAGPQRLITTLGGIMSMAVTLCCLTLVPRFVIRGRAYVKARELLIEKASARIQDES